MKQTFILLILCILIGCSTTDAERPDSARVDEPRGSDCILDGTVRDYQVLARSDLVVTDARKQKYHMRLNRPASGLESAWGVGFTTQGARICPGSSGLVVNGGLEPDVIGISSIRAIDQNEYQNLLVRFGKKVPAEVQTTPDRDVQGADVEELD